MARNWPCIGNAVQAGILTAALLALGSPAKAQNRNATNGGESLVAEAARTGAAETAHSAAAHPAHVSAASDHAVETGSPHYPAKPEDDAIPAERGRAPAPEAGGTPPNGAPSSSTASAAQPYERSDQAPITGRGRLRWFVRSTVGPVSLAGGVASSAFGTGLDDPHEYGGTWAGFGERYGMRLTGVSTSNAMEAGLGAVSGEDPRYFRDADAPFGSRVWHVIRMTFVARQSDGSFAPAYARYAAISGSNYLSNTWRPRSESGPGHAATRILAGLGGRMAGNAFSEFWPDVSERIFHRQR